MVSKKIGVIYLVWMPYGVELLERFLKSYTTYNSGADHELIILFNGIAHAEPNETERFKEVINAHSVNVDQFLYSDTGQDIKVYREAAQKLKNEYILVLNSYSQILSHNWLSHYVNAIDPSVGVIGATASNASYVRSVNNSFARLRKQKPSLKKLFKVVKYIIKLNVFLSSKFGSYPNPHIRTTGFLINRELFLSLHFRDIKIKHHAYYFENGRMSFTNQLLQKGFKCKVVDKHGKIWDLSESKNSHTFWIGDQENLLLSDNQTDSYKFGDSATKSALQNDAWG